MTPDFDATDPATWPVVLTADQVAAIYQRPVGGLKKACQLHRCHPAPFQKPYRWRKADVLRDLATGRDTPPYRRIA
jgi:hypothetical protein